MGGLHKIGSEVEGIDLLLTAGLLGLSFALSILPPGHLLRVIVTLTALLIVPGYVGTLAVFPANRRSGHRSRDRDGRGRVGPNPAGLDLVERVALSFGLSVVLLPLFAMGLALFGLGYSPFNILGIVSLFTIPVGVVGLVRRYRTPSAIRYQPTGETIHRFVSQGLQQGSPETALNVVLVVVVISAMASLGLAIAAPQDGAAYTQVNLLSEGIDGNLTAADYPTNLTRGETGELVLVVTNREDETIRYSVVSQLQRVGEDGAVRERMELARFQRQVVPEESWHIRHEFNILWLGDELRVTYLVYRDGAPDNPTINNAYRAVYLWIDVKPIEMSSTSPREE